MQYNKHRLSISVSVLLVSLLSSIVARKRQKRRRAYAKRYNEEHTRFFSTGILRLLPGIVICIVIRNQAEEMDFNSPTKLVVTLPTERSSICCRLNEGTKVRNLFALSRQVILSRDHARD